MATLARIDRHASPMPGPGVPRVTMHDWESMGDALAQARDTTSERV
jgi:hypothetical protein